MRLTNKLTPAGVASTNKVGRYSDGGGLYLQIGPTGGGSWLFRYMINGRARWQGLGAVDTFSLKEARDRARIQRQMLADGIDPLEARKDKRSAERNRLAREKMFVECAAIVIEQKGKVLKSAKALAQWNSTFKQYVFPTFGNTIVGKITKHDVVAVLQPIWHEKSETASRLRGRIEAVFDYARAMGYFEGDNPASWRGCLEPLLGNLKRKRRHHPALPYDQVATFMAALAGRAGIAPKALAFAILTATRSKEVREATWREIDFAKQIWTIPADRMKKEYEHVVPLSDAAIAILNDLPRIENVDFIFPSARFGALSDAAVSAVVKRMNGDVPIFLDRRTGEPVVPHGFRSTFRDWAGEITKHERETIEHALAHLLKDQSEAAYQRGAYLEKRRVLMSDWSVYCSSNVAKIVL